MNSVPGTLLKSAWRRPRLVRSLVTSPKLNEIFTVQDDNDFDERVIKSQQPVIIDFYASPCKILTPRLESLLANNDKVHLAKINVDDNEFLAEKYEVSSIPTVFGIKDGKIVNGFVGIKDEDELRAFVDQLLIK